MRVLASLGMQPRVPGAIEEFADPAKREDWFHNRSRPVFQLWDPDDAFCTVDVFIRNPIDFGQLWSNSEHVDLGRTACRIAGIAGIADLFAMKAQAALPQDLRDIEELRHLLRLSGQEGA